MFDAGWKLALFIIGLVIGIIILLVIVAKMYSKKLYQQWWANEILDVDSFVCNPNNTIDIPQESNQPKYLKIAFLQHISVGDRKPSSESIPLASVPSHHMDGLQITERATQRVGSKKMPTPSAQRVSVNLSDNNNKAPIVVGTIRMGFGHHRIAYATCSWALTVDHDNPNLSSTTHSTSTTNSNTTKRTTYFHDFLNIDSSEADLIKATDEKYSKMSRITSNLGGIFESLWGKITLSGDGDALRISGLTALYLKPLFRDLPLDTPIIATHCYVALTAVACGFTNVINLVIDNHPQWFVVVPGCLNLVQGPVNYQGFLRMGVPIENLQLAGHWIPRDLVMNLKLDCQRRIQRVMANTTDNNNNPECPFQPRRLLIPVGGAGAQRKFIVEFVKALGPLVLEGKVQLFLNAGDHAHMKMAFQQALQEINIHPQDYETITTTEGVQSFQSALLSGKEPKHNITLFSFTEYFPAVATTDMLSRVADVLCCKPSELAFYPVPKLMIRRVGDHEQYSALRAAELGDGTLEAREIEDAMAFVNLFLNTPELLVEMNQAIMRNGDVGVYDGCKNAVKIALERAEKMKGVAMK